jgi:hypothetical protein
MNRYWGVKRRLREITESCVSGVDLYAEYPRRFEDLPALLRSNVDLVALDGHGWHEGGQAFYGTAEDFRVCPGALRGERGAGITAPLVVLGFCEAGAAPFAEAFAESMDRAGMALLGSTARVKRNDAERIFHPALKLLADLGAKPDPAEAHARIAALALDLGPCWRAELLRRP